MNLIGSKIKVYIYSYLNDNIGGGEKKALYYYVFSARYTDGKTLKRLKKT